MKERHTIFIKNMIFNPLLLPMSIKYPTYKYVNDDIKMSFPSREQLRAHTIIANNS